MQAPTEHVTCVTLLEAMVLTVLGTPDCLAGGALRIAQLVSAAAQSEATAASNTAAHQPSDVVSTAAAFSTSAVTSSGAEQQSPSITEAQSVSPVARIKLLLLRDLHARLLADISAAVAGCLTRPTATTATISAVGELLLVKQKDGSLAPDNRVVSELERLGTLEVVVELAGPSCQRHYVYVFQAAMQLMVNCAREMQVGYWTLDIGFWGALHTRTAVLPVQQYCCLYLHASLSQMSS